MHAHDARARLAARTPTRANPRARAQASLEGAGFTLEQLAAAGLSAVECVAAGWSKAEVASAGLAMPSRLACMGSGICIAYESR